MTTELLCHFKQFLCGVLTACTLVLIQNNIFNRFFQFFGNIIINRHLTRIDDPHSHALFDGMIKEYRVDRFTHRFITTERERYVRDTARNHGMRQVLFDPARRFNKVYAVVIMFFDPCCHRKYVRIKNNIFSRVAHFIDQNVIRTFTNFTFTCSGIGLTCFIKSHDNNCSTILAA